MANYNPTLYGTYELPNTRSGVTNSPSRISATNYSGYITNRTTGRAVTIYLASMPAAVEESYSASTYSESPVGSSQPVLGFSSVAAKQLSFSFDIDQSYLPSGYSTVQQYVYAIKKFIYPSYTSEIVNPPECFFKLFNISIIGICTAINVTWGNTVRSSSIDTAKVSITIVETKEVVGGVAN